MTTRESILNSIETILKTISVSNGYLSNPRYVSRQLITLDKIPDTVFPAILIEDLDEVDILYKTGGVATVVFELNIRMITKAEYSNNSTQINNLDNDIMRAISTDNTLGSKVSHVTVIERTSVKLEDSYPYIESNRKLHITYDGNVSTGF